MIGGRFSKRNRVARKGMFTKCRLSCAVFLVCLGVCDLRAQDGPSVEVFNGRDELGDVGSSSLWRFPVKVSVAANAGVDTGVNTSPSSDNQSSWFAQTGVNLDYAFGTSRTRATLSTGGGLSYYPDVGEYDPSAFLKLQVRHEASRRLRLSARVFATYGAEPAFSLSADPDLDITGTNRRSGNFLRSTGSISASYQWLPRISTVTSYTLGLLQYGDAATADFQNRVEHRFSQQFRYLLFPVTTILGQYRLGLTSYGDSSRDSATNSLLAGIEHTFNSRLSGSFRGGVEFRSAELKEGSRARPYLSSNLAYILGDKTELNWTTRYSLEESEVADRASRTSFRTGLGVRYAIFPRISTNLSAYYRHDTNEGGRMEVGKDQLSGEDALVISLAAAYAINRHLSATVGYTHIEVDSARETRSYSRNRYFTGLRFSF